MTAICPSSSHLCKTCHPPYHNIHPSTFYLLIHPPIPPNASNCYHRYSQRHLMHPSLTSTLLRDNAIHVGDTTTTKFKAFVRQLGLHQKGIKQQRSTLLRSQTCRPRHNHNQVEGFH